MILKLLSCTFALFALVSIIANDMSVAQSCVSGAAISNLVNRGEVKPLSAVRVNGKIRRVEALCRRGSGYVYILVVQTGQDVRKVEANASR